MALNIRPICAALPYRSGNVNCYLITTGTGYLLIDTGSSNQRAKVEAELIDAGCHPGDLKLIILTHGDFDHTGNAAYLRNQFGAPIAMHDADRGMIEHGDMFWNRRKVNVLFMKLAPALFGFGAAQRCRPDIALEDGADLASYGCDAHVLHLPGHSAGSIGILTATGDLFCGDLLENTKQPALNSILDDMPTAQASLERLKRMEIHAVYPGHGQPFSWKQLAGTELGS